MDSAGTSNIESYNTVHNNTVVNNIMLVSYVAVCMISLNKLSDVVVKKFINIVSILVLILKWINYKNT